MNNGYESGEDDFAMKVRRSKKRKIEEISNEEASEPPQSSVILLPVHSLVLE
jgi:hypothetical protein